MQTECRFPYQRVLHYGLNLCTAIQLPPLPYGIYVLFLGYVDWAQSQSQSVAAYFESNGTN
ncbi:hypothetical protein CW304_13515 [Bacillus sp. UFRGS-B20]|nr:hypothetical protein CW304_13515 [Bacillus sp. UFRGS-B20]